MRILPVLDLLGGVVVRGVAGRRHEYRPVESILCHGAQPAIVAQALVQQFGFRDAYVADLDAIGGKEPAWDDYRAAMDAGLELWVDAGINSVERAQGLLLYEHRGRALASVIVGLESILDRGQIAEFVRVIGSERLVFSLDLHQGVPRTQIDTWRTKSPFDVGRLACEAGVRRLIVLDLAGVGVSGGVSTLNLCRELRAFDSSLEIITGGGVRGVEDLRTIAAAECDGALVASALHDGRITRGDLANLS